MSMPSERMPIGTHMGLENCLKRMRGFGLVSTITPLVRKLWTRPS